MNLLVAIPAYNEAGYIGQVISSIPKSLPKVKKIDIVVINDGSEDNTKTVAKKTGAIVLTHLLNRGLGGALATGFEYAKRYEYDMLITMDADGQHDAKDLPSFINSLNNGNADVVIGSRWRRKGKAPLSRIIVNKIANIVTFILCGIYSTDSQSGFRGFSRKAIQKIHIKTNGMEVSSEIFSEIYRNKLKYEEVPIRVIYTEYSKAKGQRISNAPDVFIRLVIRLLS